MSPRHSHRHPVPPWGPGQTHLLLASGRLVQLSRSHEIALSFSGWCWRREGGGGSRRSRRLIASGGSLERMGSWVHVSAGGGGGLAERVLGGFGGDGTSAARKVADSVFELLCCLSVCLFVCCGVGHPFFAPASG